MRAAIANNDRHMTDNSRLHLRALTLRNPLVDSLQAWPGRRVRRLEHCFAEPKALIRDACSFFNLICRMVCSSGSRNIPEATLVTKGVVRNVKKSFVELRDKMTNLMS